jgi:hypothetical protein
VYASPPALCDNHLALGERREPELEAVARVGGRRGVAALRTRVNLRFGRIAASDNEFQMPSLFVMYEEDMQPQTLHRRVLCESCDAAEPSTHRAVQDALAVPYQRAA